ncbi:MAG: hypothetical protein EZS28_028682 [Streblomastix strix]|uniref:Uncharacterized protein n=1 Tax=Streblomastix strix TaxID=222440 RepID=A0A5J4V0C3_9EUKA|nr:MAG: hypothetical protein EZS28_028682 [Streblomastix strix]
MKFDINGTIGVKRWKLNTAEFSDDEEELLDAARKFKKRNTSWPKYELSNPWPEHEYQAAYDVAAASAISTNSSIQAFEGFNLPPKRRLELLLKNFRLSLRSAQLSLASCENKLISFQGQHIVAAAPPFGTFRFKRLSSLDNLQKLATQFGLIGDQQSKLCTITKRSALVLQLDNSEQKKITITQPLKPNSPMTWSTLKTLFISPFLKLQRSVRYPLRSAIFPAIHQKADGTDSFQQSWRNLSPNPISNNHLTKSSLQDDEGEAK